MEKLHDVYRFVVFATMIPLLSCSIKSQENTQGSMQDSLKLVAEQFEKWENGFAVFFDLLDNEVAWTVSGRSPVSGVYNGKDDFLKRCVQPITAKLKEPLKPELVSLTADDQFIWLHFKARAKTKSEEIYENTYIWKLQLKKGKIISAVAFLDTNELVELMQTKTPAMTATIQETKGYLGMWVTKDGYIRHELLPNNRYDEARGNQKSAYRGSYKITGNHIDYKDDTGFNADGEFKDGILYHAGMILHREKR